MSNATTMTASQIAAALNAQGYRHFGSTARGWDGGNVRRIYFGAEYVTIEQCGEIHNRRGAKARANTIGASAVDAVQAVCNG